MTINWFSPLPPEPSPVARLIEQLLPALARKVKVILWTVQENWSPHLETLAEVLHYDAKAMPWAKINAAEVTIYHFANDVAQHAPIWYVSRDHPGLVVLHEADLQPLITGLLQRGLVEPGEYLRMMEFHHGGEGLAAAAAFLAGNCALAQLSAFPLLGAALENALGLVAPREMEAELAAITSLPLAFLPSSGADSSVSEIERCADGLLRLIDATEKTRLELATRWLSGRVGQLLQPWYGEQNARLLLPETARALAGLLGAESR